MQEANLNQPAKRLKRPGGIPGAQKGNLNSEDVEKYRRREARAVDQKAAAWQGIIRVLDTEEEKGSKELRAREGRV